MIAASKDEPARSGVGLACLLVVTAFAFLEGTVMAIELPEIVADLGVSDAIGDLAMTVLIAVSAAVLIAVGRLADRYGRRRVCLAGVRLAVLATAGMACAWNGPSLLLARVAQGVATAMILTSIALVKSMYPPEQRSQAFAAFGAAMGAGLLLAPVLGSIAVAAGSWRASFWIVVPVLVVAHVGIARYVPESRAEKGSSGVDVPGTILLASALLLALTALSEGGRLGWFWERGAGSFDLLPRGLSVVPVLVLGSLLFFGSFAGVELARRSQGKDVLMDPSLLRTSRFRLGCVVSFLFVLGGYSLQFLAPLLAIDRLDLSAADAGTLCAVSGAGIVGGGLAAAPLGTRLGSRGVVLAGLLQMIVGIVALSAALRLENAVPAFLAALLAVGLGYGLTYARITEVALQDVSMDQVGLASGMLVAARTCAMALGGAAVTSLVTGGSSAPTHLGHVSESLGLCVVALLAAVAATGRLGSDRDPAARPRGDRLQETTA